MERIKPLNPEKFEKIVMKNDEFLDKLLKSLSFENVQSYNKFADKYELPIKK